MALVNASHAGANTRRNFRRELDADLAEFHVVDGEYPHGFDYDAFVVTGSRSSVYWDEEWIAPTEEWVEEAIDRGMPGLGICFGHQLLAHVLGAEVADIGEYELGYRTVEHDGGRLFEGVDEEFTVFTTHSDAVVELPPGAEETARNDYGVHGFRKGHVFGVQSHPEYDRETAEAVTRGKDLPDERIQSVLEGIDEENYRRACEAKQVFDNFRAYVREVRAEHGAPARVGD
jgi:GMP synthase (glutamine-hydrolysing)